MRILMTLAFCVFMPMVAVAGDVLRMDLGANWERKTPDRPTENGWSWHTWQRRDRAGLLTIARMPMKTDLKSYGDLDRAMDFASSAYPEWLNSDDFPSWRDTDPDHGFSPRFLKLQAGSTHRPDTNGKAKEVAIISYVMVNDDERQPFMANGFVVCIAGHTYYIQHNSKKPISDDTARDALDKLMHQLDGDEAAEQDDAHERPLRSGS